jgi:hypothetical protein
MRKTRTPTLQVPLARLCRRGLFPEHRLGGDHHSLIVCQVPPEEVSREDKFVVAYVRR